MKQLLIGFLIFLLVLLLLALPFKIKVKFFGDAVNMACFYSIKVAFIKLFCGKAYIEDNKFIMQNTHNLFMQSSEISPKEIEIIKQIVSSLKITRTEFYFTGGIDNDAYSTAMLCGNVYASTSAVVAYLITKNPFINIYLDVDTSFNRSALDLAVSAIVEISILDIIFALIIALKKYKENQNGKV